jgi:hypothetical protein
MTCCHLILFDLYAIVGQSKLEYSLILAAGSNNMADESMLVRGDSVNRASNETLLTKLTINKQTNKQTNSVA